MTINEILMNEGRIKIINKIRQDSVYYHEEDKGCVIKKKYHEAKDLKYYNESLHYYWCNTHDIEICRCGWAVGWHYNKRRPKKEFVRRCLTKKNDIRL